MNHPFRIRGAAPDKRKGLMTKFERHGAHGEMRLKRNWTESSSGACEAFDDLDLESSEDGMHVILIKSQGEKDATMETGSTLRERRIAITVPDLVRLIEEHGQAL
jgi:hypothetical protein